MGPLLNGSGLSLTPSGCGPSMNGLRGGRAGFASGSSSSSNSEPPSTVGWASVGLLATVGGGVMLWYEHKKAQAVAEAMAKQNDSIGKPAIGGPFSLKDTEGNVVTEEVLKGRYSLVYFGFTFCPDACPAELTKQTESLEVMRKRVKAGEFDATLVPKPIFITLDPERDSGAVMAEYIKDFDRDTLALTGSKEATGAAAKAYRVYYSFGPGYGETDDYLVDHTIVEYLMDPDGDFVALMGPSHPEPEDMAKAMEEAILKNEKLRARRAAQKQ